MTAFDKVADDAQINKTVDALKQNGITAVVVENGEEAKKKVLELIPEGSEVMDMTSITLATIGMVEEVQNSGRYKSVKQKLSEMNRETDGGEMQKLGAAPEYVIGSVHAITEEGKVVVASNTGSQLPAYSYGAQHVVWVVGAQKIVANLDEAMKRINEYILPLETERAREVYGLPNDWHSFPSKLLIFNREVDPERIKIILVKEKLGF